MKLINEQILLISNFLGIAITIILGIIAIYKYKKNNKEYKSFLFSVIGTILLTTFFFISYKSTTDNPEKPTIGPIKSPEANTMNIPINNLNYTIGRNDFEVNKVTINDIDIDGRKYNDGLKITLDEFVTDDKFTNITYNIGKNYKYLKGKLVLFKGDFAGSISVDILADNTNIFTDAIFFNETDKIIEFEGKNLENVENITFKIKYWAYSTTKGSRNVNISLGIVDTNVIK